MVFFELRWNYSPLKEKAVPLPGGLFVYLGRSATNRLRFLIEVERDLLLMRAARRPRAWRLDVVDKICRCALHRYLFPLASRGFSASDAILPTILGLSPAQRIFFISVICTHPW